MKNGILSRSYNNEFRWRNVFRIFLYALGMAILCVLIFLFFDLIFFGYKGYIIPPYQKEPYFIWPMTVFLFVPLIFLIIIYIRKSNTGEYSIIDNNLIVHEHFPADVKLTISITSIADVQYTSYFSGWSFHLPKPIFRPFRFLEITVEGQKYELGCVTHAQELHDELRKRIKTENGNNK